LLGTWLLVQSWPGLAQESAAAERQRIQLERRNVETRYQEDLGACALRFAVNACRDDARNRRREGLAPLRQQELILSDRERKQRAAARAQDIERNRLAADARALAPPPVASAVRGRAPPSPASAAQPAVPEKGTGSSGSTMTPTAAQKAAQRASETAQRQLDAQADRERIRSRVAKRDAAGKKAAPLPPPETKP
jgi:hypothetical protein